MPITSSAKKKSRRDNRRRSMNATQRSALKEAVKSARRKPGADSLKSAQKALDKAAKSGAIHPNKAARLKSRLAKKSKNPDKKS